MSQTTSKNSTHADSAGGAFAQQKSTSPVKRETWICILLVLATVAVYWPVTTHEFVNYDDPVYITDNPHVQDGLTKAGIAWAFGRIAGDETYWHPLTWMSHMLDCQFFGLKAGWHHAMNLLFHIGNVVLLFLLLKRMTGAIWRSAVVVALFALHPLQVETVAWVTERKNVLSTFFWLLTMWNYVGYARAKTFPKKILGYMLVILFFALGLMCKPMLVTLPLVLLLLDYWPLKRISGFEFRAGRWGRLFVEKIPFFVLSVVASVITVLAHEQLKIVATTGQLPLPSRVVHAVVSYALYVKKTFWPDDLAVCYLRPSRWPLQITSISFLFLFAVSGLALLQIRRRPFLFVGWFWFLGTLVPVIGLLQVGTQSMADRFVYVPIIGLFIMLVWSAGEFFSKMTRSKTVPGIVASLAILAAATATWFQAGYWKNSGTLFTHALKVTPSNWLAHHNLGHDFLMRKKYPEAIAQFAEALRIRPGYADAHCNWGVALGMQEKFDEAILHFSAAINLKSNYPAAHFNWANTLTLQGKFDEAEAHFLTANLQKPDYADARISFGNLYMIEGKIDLALAQYYEGVRLKPGNAEGHYYLASALAQQKKMEEATEHFYAAIKIKTNYTMALNDLAWILATSENLKVRNAVEAIRLAQRACELTDNQDANCLDTLAAASSEAGRFDDAIKTAEHAVHVALTSGNRDFAAKIESRLKQYRLGQSYRNTTFGHKP